LKNALNKFPEIYQHNKEGRRETKYMDTKRTDEANSHMIQSPPVMKQLKELERENTKGNTKGSTNEIQPMVTDEGVNQ
jgi:hypothetical protein